MKHKWRLMKKRGGRRKRRMRMKRGWMKMSRRCRSRRGRMKRKLMREGGGGRGGIHSSDQTELSDCIYVILMTKFR